MRNFILALLLTIGCASTDNSGLDPVNPQEGPRRGTSVNTAIETSVPIDTQTSVETQTQTVTETQPQTDTVTQVATDTKTETTSATATETAVETSTKTETQVGTQTQTVSNTETKTDTGTQTETTTTTVDLCLNPTQEQNAPNTTYVYTEKNVGVCNDKIGPNIPYREQFSTCQKYATASGSGMYSGLVPLLYVKEKLCEFSVKCGFCKVYCGVCTP